MVRKPDGYTITVDPEAPRPVESDTLQCRHCGYHWRVQPGSGTKRGFCRNCMGPLCGKPQCLSQCEHWQAKLDRMEKEQRRIIVPGE